jgi:hypothetical protein
MSAYLGDAQRGTPVSCRRGDNAAAMASYTKQAKDESLQYLAMRARASAQVPWTASSMSATSSHTVSGAPDAVPIRLVVPLDVRA